MTTKERLMGAIDDAPDELLDQLFLFLEFLRSRQNTMVEEVDRDYQVGLSGLMTEWDSEEDEEAYGYLQSV
jgi:hypothetical protein